LEEAAEVGISLQTLITCCLWPVAVSLVAVWVQAHASERRLSFGDLLVGLGLAVGAVGTVTLFLLQVDTLTPSDGATGWKAVTGLVALLWFFAESLRRRRLLRQQPLTRRVIGVSLCNIFGLVYLFIAAVLVDDWT
jgi:MFS family permease